MGRSDLGRGVGWIVPTNKGGPVLLYERVARVLDCEGQDAHQWISDFYEQQETEPDTTQADTTEALRDTPTVVSAPSHPDDYVAEYSNSGYGTFAVTIEDGTIRGSTEPRSRF